MREKLFNVFLLYGNRCLKIFAHQRGNRFRYGYVDAFLDRFRHIFVSGELRLIKPDPAIYRHTVTRIGALAASCLFIDDSGTNIAAAAAEGLQVHHFTTPERLRAELESLDLLGRR